ncbi:mitochondrial ribosomal subunit protein-domain-containing protein [Geranomyces variabilis]|nr:mitochondrial ribosomal subunit protein-domain-containing protein [Geranomyces variabilis]KAJ3134179.1 37S ribosomal protein S24, mitochondrial [Geranomyces variabilis]
MLARRPHHSLVCLANRIATRQFSVSATLLAPKPAGAGPRQRDEAGFSALTGDIEKDGVHRFEMDFLETAQWVKEMLHKMKDDQKMLQSKARPYTPKPPSSHPLCFQTSTLATYDFSTPAPYNTRVLLHVRVADLALEPARRHQLLLLAGDRYDPYTDVVTMEAETSDVARTGNMTADRDKNKETLRSAFAAMLEEAKTAKDSFTDVPLDMRHIPVKRAGLEFPESWLRPPPPASSSSSSSSA